MVGTPGFLAPELKNATDDATVSFPASVTSRNSWMPSGWSGKVDTYSFGVTLQLVLLGEDGGRHAEIRGKGPMILPLHSSDEENREMLRELHTSGRLSVHAHALLVEHLLCTDPRKRSLLEDPEVSGHAFFLEALNCESLTELMTRSPPPRRWSSTISGIWNTTDDNSWPEYLPRRWSTRSVLDTTFET